MMTMQRRATEMVLKALHNLSYLIRKALPMKNAMKIESRTPVERVSVLIPKKKQARRADEARGTSNNLQPWATF